MRRPLSLNRALLGALLLHAALFAAFGARSRVRGGGGGSVATPIDAPTLAEVELEGPSAEVVAPRAPAEAASPTQAHRTEARASSAAGARQGAGAPDGHDDAATSTRGSPADATASAPPGEGWTFAPTRADLGVTPGGTSATMRAAVAATVKGEAPPGGSAAMASVLDALDDAERVAGRGVGGPLVGVTRDAVREGLTSDFGHATLEFRTDGTGLVVSVRVVDVSADRRAWDDVAQKLVESAKKRRLAVPAGSRGVAVTVRVDSAVKTASNHDAGETSISVFGIPVKKSSAPHPLHVDVAIPMASMNLDPTDALLDATTKPRRVVSVWVESERRL